MATIGIAAYAIRARLKRTSDPLYLGTLSPPGGLHGIVKGFLGSLKKTHARDEESQLLQRVIRLDTDVDSCWGLLESGEYGFEAKGVDINTLKPSYKRKSQDAELIPFYFRLYLPSANDTGIMLLQRHGPRGVFHSFSSALRDFVGQKLPDHALDITRLVPAEVLGELLKGGVRAVEITTYKVPTDIADKYRFLGNLQKAGTVTVEFKAKKKAYLFPPSWLKRITTGQTKVVELPVDLGPGRIRLKVDYHGKTRVVDLSSPETIAPYTDATDDLDIQDSGHPSYESVDSYCTDLLRELLEQLGKA